MTSPTIPEESNGSTSTCSFSTRYRWYVLGVLTVVYAVNFIDRQILVLLQESIKAEMGLTDAQLGLLSVFAFALFYVSAGIPIARWADQGNRRSIVALSITVWSGMTAVCGRLLPLTLVKTRVKLPACSSPPPRSSQHDIRPAGLPQATMGSLVIVLKLPLREPSFCILQTQKVM